MARFGQGFIQALTNPSYQQGLFTAAQGPGIALGEAAEKEQKQKMLQQFMQGSPLQQGRLLQQEGLRTGDLELALKGQDLEKQTLKQGAAQGIQALVTQIANPETDDTLAAESRETALRLARDNNVPEDRVRTALDAAEKTRLTKVFSENTAKINGLTDQARMSISAGKSKEEFVASYGEKFGFVYDSVKQDNEIKESRLAVARDNKLKTEYQYTDEGLKSTFGFTDAMIDTVNALPTGSEKNAAVFKFVLTTSDKKPVAALLRFYADAELPRIMRENNFDYDDEDELKKGQAMAAEFVRNSLELTGGDPAGMAEASVDRTNNNSSDEIDIDSAILKIQRSLTNGS